MRSPGDAANHLLRKIYTPFEQFDQEELWTLLLNTKNRVTHEVLVYRGTLNTVHIRLAEVFKEAVRINAASMIVNLHTQRLSRTLCEPAASWVMVAPKPAFGVGQSCPVRTSCV